MSRSKSVEAPIEVYLPAEQAWVIVERHRKDPNGWLAYEAGERIGIAPPEHWRTRQSEELEALA